MIYEGRRNAFREIEIGGTKVITYANSTNPLGKLVTYKVDGDNVRVEVHNLSAGERELFDKKIQLLC